MTMVDYMRSNSDSCWEFTWSKQTKHSVETSPYALGPLDPLTEAFGEVVGTAVDVGDDRVRTEQS